MKSDISSRYNVLLAFYSFNVHYIMWLYVTVFVDITNKTRLFTTWLLQR